MNKKKKKLTGRIVLSNRKRRYLADPVHNWSLQPFSPDYDLAFHTTYVVCIKFIQVDAK